MLKNIIPAVESTYLQKSKGLLRKMLTTKIKNSLNLFDLAKFWDTQGAKIVQIIEDNEPKNIRNVNLGIPCLKIVGGGGINSFVKADEFLKAGADYLVISRHLAAHPTEIPDYFQRYGGKLIVSLESKFEKTVPGKDSEFLKYLDFVSKTKVKNVLYVESKKILTESGISYNILKRIRGILKNKLLIYSGGVKTLMDIKLLKKAHFDGIIIGTALYNQRFSFQEACDSYHNCS